MNTVTIKMQDETMRLTMLELRDIAQEAVTHKTPHVVSGVCTVLASLVAFSGPHGSTAQRNMMDLATSCGFSPEYYGSGVRISFVPPDGKNFASGKGQKRSA